MTTRYIILTVETSNVMTTSVTTMHFSLNQCPLLKEIKRSFERSYDEQNITLVVISYEMTTRVISSIYSPVFEVILFIVILNNISYVKG